MSNEITPCEICSTENEKVMPVIIYDGALHRWKCLSCGVMAQGLSNKSETTRHWWNDLMSKIAAKIESVAAEREQAARKAERVKVVEEFCASLMDYAAKYYDSSTVADVRAVECTDIRAVAEEVKAGL